MTADIESWFGLIISTAPPGSYATLRVLRAKSRLISVQRGVVRPIRFGEDSGAMWTVSLPGRGVGYGATSDLTLPGLTRAFERARDLAVHLPMVTASDQPGRSQLTLKSSSVGRGNAGFIPTAEAVDALVIAAGKLAGDTRIVDWSSGLWEAAEDALLLTSAGGHVEQQFHYVAPHLGVSAYDEGETQSRTFKGGAFAGQRGSAHLDFDLCLDAAPRLQEEVLELLYAQECPAERTDLLLAPDQMILQIHESIGHPLELDRILGDERNYAGSSFVTLDMFGTYQYGSALLNVTFAPDVEGQFASYEVDDEGTEAERVHLIRDGRLVRPLGGGVSQARASSVGTANARASNWNRPPIDRMANINVEPGESSWSDLIGAVERGVFMETNSSWSIDDRRNKFQFGCERGRLIRDGALGPVVKKPNYRGISAEFWRSLDGVGDRSTWEVLGTPNCGKGEPNQAIRVGHAAPVCLFRDVDVFGGA